MEKELMDFIVLMKFDIALFLVALGFSIAGGLRSVIAKPYKGKITIENLKKEITKINSLNTHRIESANILFKFTRIFMIVWLVFTCFLAIQYGFLPSIK